jgi:hypothetical protein
MLKPNLIYYSKIILNKACQISLIKLIFRETGKTTYELLETYRGSFTAYFWQGMTKFYGGNLKDEYNPVEDWQIEQIIKQLGFE